VREGDSSPATLFCASGKIRFLSLNGCRLPERYHTGQQIIVCSRPRFHKCCFTTSISDEQLFLEQIPIVMCHPVQGGAAFLDGKAAFVPAVQPISMEISSNGKAASALVANHTSFVKTLRMARQPAPGR
jgi:hypothetical protein